MPDSCKLASTHNHWGSSHQALPILLCPGCSFPTYSNTSAAMEIPFREPHTVYPLNLCMPSQEYAFSGDKLAQDSVLMCIIWSCNHSFTSKYLSCAHHECKRHSTKISKQRCFIWFKNIFRRLWLMFSCLILTHSNHHSGKNIHQLVTWKMFSISHVFHLETVKRVVPHSTVVRLR